MKVLKTESVKTSKIRTCGNCKSKLEYEPKDVKLDRDGHYIICPVCDKFLSV